MVRNECSVVNFSIHSAVLSFITVNHAEGYHCTQSSCITWPDIDLSGSFDSVEVISAVMFIRILGVVGYSRLKVHDCFFR